MKKILLISLEKELKCKVFIIPADPEDKVGHSDGMVRFIDRDTVFINDPLGGTRKWQKKFHDTLKKYRLNAVKIPCTLKEKSGTADGLHMNYLHVGNQIVLPEFGKGHKDEEALKLMKDVMGNRYDVITYDAKRFSKNGGVLNCATWSVYQ